jgi:hypothetical protein
MYLSFMQDNLQNYKDKIRPNIYGIVIEYQNLSLTVGHY